MNSNIDLLARDLVRLLSELAGVHGEMAALGREKLAAMRKADSILTQSITAQELSAAEKAAEREGLRRQITRKLLEALGVDVRRAANIRLGELAELLAEPRRSRLLTAALGLRSKVEELQQIQRVTALTANEMLKHLGQVVAVMRGGGLAAESYTRGGRRAANATASVFEAVG